MAKLSRYGINREDILVPPEVESFVRYLRKSLVAGGHWGQYENWGPVDERYMAKQVARYFDDTDAEPDAVEVVCEWVDGLPWENASGAGLLLNKWVQLWFDDDKEVGDD